MTSDRRHSPLVLLAVLALAWLVPASASADARVAVAAFAGDNGGFADYLAGELSRRTGRDVRTVTWTVGALDALGCPGANASTAPGCLPRLAGAERVDVLLEGAVEGGAAPTALRVSVYDAGSSMLVREVLVPLPGSLLEEPLLTDAINALDAGITRIEARSAATSDANARRSDRIRIALHPGATRRAFELSQGDETITFDAPYYGGLALHLEAYPVAFFARDSIAAGLGLVLETSKHDVSTVTDISTASGARSLTVPTRHDESYYGLRFEWAVTDRVLVVPGFGWRIVEYALGNNPLYSNSFYQSPEISIGAWWTPSNLRVGGAFALRPAVSLGSTVEPWGDDASSFGLAFAADVTWRFDFGLFIGGGLDWARYTTAYSSPSRPSADATDSLQSFVLTAGYAY